MDDVDIEAGAREFLAGALDANDQAVSANAVRLNKTGPEYFAIPVAVAIRAIAAALAEVDQIRQKLRMVVSHSTGGTSSDITRSVNDICVMISRHHNRVYQGGKDAAIKSENKLDNARKTS